MKEALVRYVVSVTKIFYGLFKENFMRLTYKFAVVNKLHHANSAARYV